MGDPSAITLSNPPFIYLNDAEIAKEWEDIKKRVKRGMKHNNFDVNMNRKDMHRQKKIYSRCKEASDDNKSTTDIALELQGNVNTLGCCPTDVHKLVSMEICDIKDIEVLRKVKLDRLEEQRKHNEKNETKELRRHWKKINKK